MLVKISMVSYKRDKSVSHAMQFWSALHIPYPALYVCTLWLKKLCLKDSSLSHLHTSNCSYFITTTCVIPLLFPILFGYSWLTLFSSAFYKCQYLIHAKVHDIVWATNQYITILLHFIYLAD